MTQGRFTSILLQVLNVVLPLCYLLTLGTLSICIFAGAADPGRPALVLDGRRQRRRRLQRGRAGQRRLGGAAHRLRRGLRRRPLHPSRTRRHAQGQPGSVGGNRM